MRPCSSGDMSCCLCSCLTSSLLIFSDFSWLWRDQPTSAIAITTSTPRTRQARSSTSPPMKPASWLGCSAPIDARSLRRGQSVRNTTPETIVSLAMLLTSSTRLCGEKMRRAPDFGLTRLKSGFRFVQDELRAHLRDRGEQSAARDGDHERQRDDEQRLHEQVQRVVEAAVREVGRGHRLEGVAHRRLQVPEHRRAHRGEVGERGAEDEQASELRGTRNLTLLAGLVPPLRGGLLGAFGVCQESGENERGHGRTPKFGGRSVASWSTLRAAHPRDPLPSLSAAHTCFSSAPSNG